MKYFFVLVFSIFLIAGCNKTDNTTAAPVTQYNTFTIHNSTFYATKQLTKLEVTPVNGGATLSADFVCSYGSADKQVQMSIPSTGQYMVKIYSSDGQSMWWNSIGLELPGTTYLMVTCSGSPITFNGSCASMAMSGTNMVP